MTTTDRDLGLAPDAGREPTRRRVTRPPSARWTAERWAQWMESVKAAQAATVTVIPPDTTGENSKENHVREN